MKLLYRFVGILMAALVISAAGLYWHNNRPTSPPSRAAIDAAFDRGVSWLLENRSALLRDARPTLWWMIGESARTSGDARLSSMYAEFRSRFDQQEPMSPWQPLLAPARYWNAEIPRAVYRQLAEYQQYFIFASTCADNMKDDPVILAQNDPAFCRTPAQLRRQTCTTHQMMGLRLAQRNGCPVPGLDTSIGRLQQAISLQLSFDPRVVDVYIQRVLMLVDSGALGRVKARWLTRVLQAQLADGGWDDVQPVLSLPENSVAGLTSKGLFAGTRKGTFHATAQGVWLMSMLRNQAQADLPELPQKR